MTNSSVGRAVVEALVAEGVTHAFTVPGESFLGILDAFNDEPSPIIVSTRHEEGAGFMAQALAQATNRPGVVLVTRAPGVTHLSIALHTAMQDSLPVLAIVGQVTTEDAGREAFQEIDLLAYGRTLCKAAFEVRMPERAAEIVAHALYVAQSGRPGPVLVAIPEDVANANNIQLMPAKRQRLSVSSPAPTAISQFQDMVNGSRSIAMVVGAGVLRARATDEAVRLAESLEAAVYTGFRRFDAFPNNHRCYAGNLPWLSQSMLEPLRSADLVLALGTRMGDFTSLGYTVPSVDQKLVQVDLDSSAMSVVRVPDLAIIADVGTVIREVLEKLPACSQGLITTRARTVTAAHEAYIAGSTAPHHLTDVALVDLPAAIGILSEVVPSETAIVSDAGAFSTYLNRYYRWTQPGTFYGTASGAMGYAVPTAVAVKLAEPARPVVAVVGDGGFAMTMSEIHTAVHLGLSQLVFLVFDNSTYGTIRYHQLRAFPGRDIAVEIGRSDLAAMGRAMGAAGVTVSSSSELGSVLSEAIQSEVPTVVHALTDPDQLSAWG